MSLLLHTPSDDGVNSAWHQQDRSIEVTSSLSENSGTFPKYYMTNMDADVNHMNVDAKYVLL